MLAVSRSCSSAGNGPAAPSAAAQNRGARLARGRERGEKAFEPLLEPKGVPSGVFADVHEFRRIRRQIEDQGAAPNIPDRSNRTQRHCFTKTLYKHRNLVERFFNKIKSFRHLATRYDKLDSSFLAMLKFAAIRLWLRHNESTA